MSRAHVVGRFAPSPSGRMHLGNVWSFLLAWLSARSAGGSVVLRLEDLDPERCRREYAEQILRDLDWLGLGWDGTPLWQSQRTDAYRDAFETLRREGLVYPCFCSRTERLAASAPHGAQGPSRDPCRALSPEEQAARARQRRPAWRLRAPEKVYGGEDLLQGRFAQNLARECGDFILRRSDGVFAYQLAVVVDDAYMGVTEVVRGADLLPSTPRQLCLYDLLGHAPPRFGHVPLLLAPDGRRLAKRERDLDLGVLRERCTAPELLGRLAVLAGLLPEYQPVRAEALLPRFAWEKLPRRDLTLEERSEADVSSARSDEAPR